MGWMVGGRSMFDARLRADGYGAISFSRLGHCLPPPRTLCTFSYHRLASKFVDLTEYLITT